MASKSKTVSVKTCDFCGTCEHCYDKCLGCGKDVCFDCKDKQGTDYHHAVFFSGSNDGYYCSECDTKLSASGDKRLLAYKAIRNLRHEYEGHQADFKKRMEAAEAHLRTFPTT